MVAGVELRTGRMPHDHDPALADERPAPVHVEEVAEPEARHQDGVHDGVHVVGADVGQPHGEDVGLALDVDALLRPDVGRGEGVDGLHLARLHRRHGVRRADGLEDLSGRRVGTLDSAADEAA